MDPSRHVAVTVAAPADAVTAYVRDPRNLPHWAAGLATSEVHEVGGRWFVDSPMGRVEIAFAPENPWGILDHDVTLPSGETVSNPLRVIPNGDGAEMVFTVRRRPGTTAEAFEADCAAVLADLETLARLVGNPGQAGSGECAK